MVLEPDMELGDLAHGEREKLYAREGELFVEGGRVLLVSGQPVQPFRDDHIEVALGDEVSICLGRGGTAQGIACARAQVNGFLCRAEGSEKRRWQRPISRAPPAAPRCYNTVAAVARPSEAGGAGRPSAPGMALPDGCRSNARFAASASRLWSRVPVPVLSDSGLRMLAEVVAEMARFRGASFKKTPRATHSRVQRS